MHTKIPKAGKLPVRTNFFPHLKNHKKIIISNRERINYKLLPPATASLLLLNRLIQLIYRPAILFPVSRRAAFSRDGTGFIRAQWF